MRPESREGSLFEWEDMTPDSANSLFFIETSRTKAGGAAAPHILSKTSIVGSQRGMGLKGTLVGGWGEGLPLGSKAIQPGKGR